MTDLHSDPQPLLPTKWERVLSEPDEGDYWQWTPDRRLGKLRRMTHAGGGTAAWAVYFDGEDLGQRQSLRDLRDARVLAYRLSRRAIVDRINATHQLDQLRRACEDACRAVAAADPDDSEVDDLRARLISCGIALGRALNAHRARGGRT